MKKKQLKISFQGEASRAKHGLVMIFDLEGFSQFFNQPDVQSYITNYLNRIFECISISMEGGTAYWAIDEKNAGKLRPLSVLPSHVKFMGDGALYIWTPAKGAKDFDSTFMTNLVNRLWNLKTYFTVVVEKCAEDVPVVELPKRIRFGLARGTIYELSRSDNNAREYIGFCVNLASRLQRYCPELGFIASARLGLSEEALKQHGYTKVIAKNLKGFPKEIVIVDENEFKALPTATKNSLFEEIAKK